jgi:hypothetical protein
MMLGVLRKEGVGGAEGHLLAIVPSAGVLEEGRVAHLREMQSMAGLVGQVAA